MVNRLRTPLIAVLGALGLTGPVLRLRNRRTARRAARADRRADALETGRPIPGLERRYVRTLHDGRRVVARHRWDRRVIDAMNDNRELVIGLLEAASVPFTSVPLQSDNRFRIAVRASDKSVIFDALAASRSGVYVYFDDRRIDPGRRVERCARLRRRTGGALDRRAERSDVWRVYEHFVDHRHRVLADIHGCEIEFWQASADDGWLESARWNCAVDRIPERAFGTTETTGPRAAPVRSTPGVVEHSDLDSVPFSVDVVFTWVDGDDPAWLERKQRALAERSGDRELNPEAANRARFTSNDELRYALRSLEEYADFVRHVYVVTDDQRPRWLVDDHPRLRLVDHKEIIPSSCLPVFNSHAIEAHLHRIDGLAEHYLYMNDDFFFLRRVGADKFFHPNGLAKFFQSRALIPFATTRESMKPVDAAAMNGRALIEKEFGFTSSRKFKHAPYPQLRSVHEEIRRRFPIEVERTASSRFRSPDDLAVASSLHHYAAFALGRAVPGSISSAYLDLGDPNLEGQLYRLLHMSNADVLCLNDNDHDQLDPGQQARLVADFLQRRFPVKSTFER